MKEGGREGGIEVYGGETKRIRAGWNTIVATRDIGAI